MSEPRQGRDGLSALVPVGVAALLIAFCLAGAQLYPSSAGSAALATQLDETCRSDSALTLPIPPNELGAQERVAEIGGGVPFVEPARYWAMADPFLSDTTVPRRLTLIWIEGADRNVVPQLEPLERGEIALSTAMIAELATGVGQRISVAGGSLLVAQEYDDVPIDPIPSFWCGYPELMIPPPSGDFRPPYAIASLETIEMLGAGTRAFYEYRVVDEPLTMTDAAALQDGYATATLAWTRAFRNAPNGVPRNELDRVVSRAELVQTTVQRNLTPVTLTGVVAGTLVLIAAGVLVARDRQRELRLLAVRGLPPWRIAGHVAPQLGGTVAVAMVSGWLLAWSAITAFGPSSNLEPGAITRSVLWVLAAAVLGLAVVAGVVGVVGDGFADVRRRRVHHRWVAVGVVVALLALAVLAFRRLDRDGGVRTFGVESRGGGLLAMGFPLFAVLAATAIGGLIVALLAPRLRLTGGSLARSIRLGWRRVVLDAGPLVAVVVSVALAAGCFTVANALAAGSERQLEEKAQVYVGADLSVDVFDEVTIPSEWEQRTTVVAQSDVRWDGERVNLLGIDPDRFPSVAALRGDASGWSLEEMASLLAAPPASGAIPAVAVGAGVDVGETAELDIPGNADPVRLDVVATADYFPTKTTGVPMFVVDRAQAEEFAPYGRAAVLVRDPPPDALSVIREGGVRTGVVSAAAGAFDGSAYSALRWAYAPLATLGVLFAVVALALQLLVVAARRGPRRVADAVMRRTGFTTRDLWRASLVETGVPLVVGAVIGIAAAVLAASLSVVRLDPMPMLAPPARFLMPWNVLVLTACVIPLWTAAIAFVIVRSTVRADPMRVFQGSA